MKDAIERRPNLQGGYVKGKTDRGELDRTCLLAWPNGQTGDYGEEWERVWRKRMSDSRSLVNLPGWLKT